MNMNLGSLSSGMGGLQASSLFNPGMGNPMNMMKALMQQLMMLMSQLGGGGGHSAPGSSCPSCGGAPMQAAQSGQQAASNLGFAPSTNSAPSSTSAPAATQAPASSGQALPQSSGGVAGGSHAGKTFQSKGTGYYPANTAMEGGFKDRHGKPLYTLQQYLRGDAPYVSVAMDQKIQKYRGGTMEYGQKLRIPELEQKYGKPIEFRVVDTGGAFTNKGYGRIDICTENRQASMDATVNGNLTLQFQ